MEYDVRRDADNIGGQHQPEEFAIFRRGREFRTINGVYAGRKRQVDGQFAGDTGTARGDRNKIVGSRKGTGFPPETNSSEFTTGKVS